MHRELIAGTRALVSERLRITADPGWLPDRPKRKMGSPWMSISRSREITNGGIIASYSPHQLDGAGHEVVHDRPGGATIKQIYWTLGAYDLVSILEAADDEVVTAFAQALSSEGNVRTTTMRAFDPAEMREIVAKAGG